MNGLILQTIAAAKDKTMASATFDENTFQIECTDGTILQDKDFSLSEIENFKKSYFEKLEFDSVKKATEKAELLKKLGISEDEAKLLLS